MINTIYLGNFKAFAETQRISIRPLTLIFGPNRAGKSSLIHSLVFARHASQTGNLDASRICMDGESIDLGGFRQYIHRRDLASQLEWGATLNVATLKDSLAKLLIGQSEVSVKITIALIVDSSRSSVRRHDNLLHEITPVVTSYQMSTDQQLILRMNRLCDGRMHLDYVEYKHPIFADMLNSIAHAASETLTLANNSKVDAVIKQIMPQLSATIEKLLPQGLSGFGSLLDMPRPLAEELPLKNYSKEFTDVIRSFFLWRTLDELIGGITDALTSELNNLSYFGSMRSYFFRNHALAFSQQHKINRLPSDNDIWQVLLNKADVRQAVNAWLGAPNRLDTPYELIVRELISLNDLHTPIFQRVEESSKNERLKMVAESKPFYATNKIKEKVLSPSLNELILYDRRSNTSVHPSDIGMGLSQLLPLLVSAFESEKKLIAIEQPEIHLHPALQAEIGDLFIQSALGERQNTFILETHSEHLILRIMRRMRNTANDELPEGLPPVTPDDVAILYVQPHGPSSIVREIELSEDGQLLDPWPGGFFEEGFRERFS